MADSSLFMPLTIAAVVAVLVCAPLFVALHFRFQAKKRSQMAEFERLRAGAPASHIQ